MRKYTLKIQQIGPKYSLYLIMTSFSNVNYFWSRPPISLFKVTFGIYRSMPIILRGIHFKTKYKYLQEPGTRKRKLKITCACAEYHDFRERKASVRHQMNIVPVFMSNNVYTGINDWLIGSKYANTFWKYNKLAPNTVCIWLGPVFQMIFDPDLRFHTSTKWTFTRVIIILHKHCLWCLWQIWSL